MTVAVGIQLGYQATREHGLAVSWGQVKDGRSASTPPRPKWPTLTKTNRAWATSADLGIPTIRDAK